MCLYVMHRKMKLIYSPLMMHYHLMDFKIHTYIRWGYPLSFVAVGLLCGFLLSMFSIAGLIFPLTWSAAMFYTRNKKRCIWIALDTLRMSQKPTNMAAVPLFWGTNMATVTSWEDQQGRNRRRQGHKFAHWAMKNTTCARLARAFHPIQRRRMTIFAFVCTM